MTDVQTATVRTAVPTAWATLLLWAVSRFGISMTEADWQVAMLALPIVTGVLYRVGRVIEGRWPRAGYVLFGSMKVPTYAMGEPVR